MSSLGGVICRLRRLPSNCCGFYKVFSDKHETIFSSYTMINVSEFNFTQLFSYAKMEKF